ncbi:MAG: hypothetical protein JWO30_841 [Fibrobacteres bacterium]|nr:hypothetical protein [Fibrobacterota bacterium]
MTGMEAIDEEFVRGQRGEPETEYFSVYNPQFISPPIRIVPLNEKYPKFVKEDLISSFQVFWTDSSACGNRIRVCVENLLAHFKISKLTPKKKFKSLESRIKEFKVQYPKYETLANNLLAIKWMGNVASHEEISREDVATAYQIFGFVLDEIFHNRKEQMDKMSRLIIKKKGKTKKKR